MTQSFETIVRAAVDLRRELHRAPELTWEEERTAATVRARLDALGIPWRECAKHGTVGTLAPDAPGEHVALRADIDALPILEEADVEWRSETPGLMHACGHDGHTAALWAAGAWLKANEAALPGPVSLLFQPAEEGGHGAKAMIEGGALDGVDVIFGWHNWPSMPFGKAVCPDGTVMSGNGTFEIEVLGLGGHASQPELNRDPVLAAAAMTVNLQQIVSRRLAPQSAAVVSVSSIDAPSKDTITPERARIGGSIRLATPDLRQPINAAIDEIVQGTAAAYGVTATVKHIPRYEGTINDPVAAARYREALAAELGPDWRAEGVSIPIMGSEDFSYYLAERPGAFALLGAAEGDRFARACHNSRYEFNDALLGPVARLYSRLTGAPLP